MNFLHRSSFSIQAGIAPSLPVTPPFAYHIMNDSGLYISNNGEENGLGYGCTFEYLGVLIGPSGKPVTDSLFHRTNQSLKRMVN